MKLLQNVDHILEQYAEDEDARDLKLWQAMSAAPADEVLRVFKEDDRAPVRGLAKRSLSARAGK